MNSGPSDTDKLRARVEQPYSTRFWGGNYTITPLLVTEVFGDGKVLMGIRPLNTRPNYYVVRVDSKFAESDKNPSPRESDEWFDFLDNELYDAIADQFGSADAEDDDGNPVREDWPALDLDSGCGWFEYELGDDDE